MKKLNKNIASLSNTVETFSIAGCTCGCACSCSCGCTSSHPTSSYRTSTKSDGLASEKSDTKKGTY